MYHIPLSKGLLFISSYLLYFATVNAACQSSNHLSRRDDNSTQAWTESSWGTIQSSKDLQWVDCYAEGLQCARLEVPLNYHDPGSDSASIALIRMPANVSTDSPDYRGPVLFNPGGPGGSGVDTVLTKGSLYRYILGPEFDLVGFDPRGVKRSTPRVEFYKSTAERVQSHHAATELNHSSETVETMWGHTKNMGVLAYERGKDYLAHINTDHSARDMLSIVEAYGQDKLQYWGFSYGSVLGYTFAAMFPDKVGRLIIDGVVDIDDYYTTKWMSGTRDFDKTVRWFLQSCQEAGREDCPFYEDTVEAMEAKLNDIYTSLIKSPVPVRTNVTYGLLDYATVHYTMLTSMYSPFVKWPPLATALQDASEGNHTALYNILAAPRFECDCDPSLHEFEATPETLNAYICNDGDPVPPELEAARSHYEESLGISPINSIWASFRIACNGWSSEIPKAQFRGPVTGNTSHPMLIIGNTADPVTSIEGAKNVSRNFPGSVVLTQDSPGHCSTNTIGMCTMKVVRDYFVNGTMPEEGTVCPMDYQPFVNIEDVDLGDFDGLLRRDTEDLQAIKVLHELAKAGGGQYFSPLQPF